MQRPARFSASFFPVSYLILPSCRETSILTCNIIVYLILFILFLVYIIFYFWVETWGRNIKNKKMRTKIFLRKIAIPSTPTFAKSIQGYALRKNTSQKTPDEINPLQNTKKPKNEKYILYYCSTFAVVFGIFEEIRNVETLIKRVAWLKNLSSPQYFNLQYRKKTRYFDTISVPSFSTNLEDATRRRSLAGSG